MDNKVLEILESKEWKDFYNYYLDIGIIEQIGLFRYEDIHTNFLASLLKKDNIYGYGLKSMKQLLKFIKENQRQDKKIMKIILKVLIYLKIMILLIFQNQILGKK